MAFEEFKFKDKELSFETRAGVFAQYGLDKGSKILLENIDIPKKGNILDLGCGCGFLGIVVAKLSPESKVVMVDSDIRAVNLSKENAARNKTTNVDVILSDTTSELDKSIKFDLVISNPPTHQGKEVLMQFLQSSYECMSIGGSAYFVVNRMMSVLDRMKEVFGNSEKIARKEGFIVFKSVKE